MKLVEDAGKAWKWFSMHAMGWPVAAIGAWGLMPEKWQDYLMANVPPKYLLGFIAAVLVLGMVGRVVKQGD